MNRNATTKQAFYVSCISAVLTLVIGITLTAAPSILVTVCRAAGGLLCAAALVLIALYFIKKRENPPLFYYGLMAAGIGTLLMLLPGLLNFLIPVLFGLWVLINSLIGLLRNFGFRGEHRFWWLGAVFNTIGAALGVYIITRPMAVMETTVRLIGIALIVFAVLRAVSVIMARHYFGDEPTGDVIDVTINKD
ncbi:MAG: DUF308 domain-containing protein [Oscillospiraceae bacterium]|nr:DUF308 domain-containing protein [Oscillospiraceae bacterium]